MPVLFSHSLFEESFPEGSANKGSAFNTGNRGGKGLIPGLGRFPWRRKWQPTPVFLPAESHGQKSLRGYSPKDHKESDITDQLNLLACLRRA